MSRHATQAACACLCSIHGRTSRPDLSVFENQAGVPETIDGLVAEEQRLSLVYGSMRGEWQEVQDRMDQDFKIALASVRERRNRQQAIYRLPHESLAEIFSYLMPSFSQSWAYSKHGKLPFWLAFTHVCRRWRFIALDCPALWTNVLLHEPNATAEMLKRSGQCSLTIHSHLNFDPDAMVLAVAEMFRVRELHLCELTEPIRRYTEMVVALSHPAPALERLSLTEFRHLSSSLFAGSTPRLRSLELRSCVLPPRITFATLESLVIDSAGNDKPRFRISAIVDVLRAAPRLKQLTMVDSLESSHQPRSPPPGDHILQLADQVTIDDCVLVACVELLRHTALPGTCKLTIANLMFTDQDQLVTFRSLFTFVDRHIAEGSKVAAPVTGASVKAGSKLIIAAWTGSPDEPDDPFIHISFMYLREGSLQVIDDWTTLALAIPSSVRNLHLRRLSSSHHVTRNADWQWPRLLSRLPSSRS